MNVDAKVTEQKGAASSTPSRFKRYVTSKVMTYLASKRHQDGRQKRADMIWKKSGKRAQVIYFHCVSDPYSMLAAQILSKLAKRYNVSIEPYVVSTTSGENNPEPEKWFELSLSDVRQIAPHLGLKFPKEKIELRADNIRLAEQLLSQMSREDFIERAADISSAALTDHFSQLELGELTERSFLIETSATDVGDAKRASLGHYGSAMFYFNGEWYWGVDRLYHLENRLRSLGLDHSPSEPLLIDRPKFANLREMKGGSALVLEFYPSLRSPYTAIIYDKILSFCRDSDITLELKPVLPMVMRGVSLTRQKGAYIMRDAGREARALGVSLGPICDPIGEPVKQCYALYPWAKSKGKHSQLIANFLQAAFFEAQDTGRIKVLRRIVENSGLSWEEAKEHLDSLQWMEELEKNRLEMLSFNSWGVPSFRLKTKTDQVLAKAWGQDRFWYISRCAHEWLASNP